MDREQQLKLAKSFLFFQLNKAICSWIPEDEEGDGDFQVEQIHSFVVTPKYTFVFKCYLKIWKSRFHRVSLYF